jgi:hypothetical protein
MTTNDGAGFPAPALEETMKARIFMTVLIALLVAGISGCSVRLRGKSDPPNVENKKEKKDEPIVGEGDHREHDKGGPPPHAHGLLKIPKGHLPPPGQCRIWMPGTPPGRQPRPGDCRTLASEVPRGAWLVYRHTTHPDRVDVTIYDEKRVGLIVEIQIYDLVTGEFIGHEVNAARK